MKVIFPWLILLCFWFFFLFHSNPCSTLPFWYKSLEFQSCDLWHMKGNLCSYFENWSHWNYQTVVPKRHLTDAILWKIRCTKEFLSISFMGTGNTSYLQPFPFDMQIKKIWSSLTWDYTNGHTGVIDGYCQISLCVTIFMCLVWDEQYITLVPTGKCENSTL